MSAEPPEVPAGIFATTRWTLVLRARGSTPEAKTALSELCVAYWEPVFRFIRHTQPEDDTARDLTQEFFSRLLSRQGLDTVEVGRGRFRSFLLGAVKHFLADVRDHARAAKRGGGEPTVSLDGRSDTAVDRLVPAAIGPPPDSHFDRAWAIALVNRAIDALAREWDADGRREQFDVLKPWLLGEIHGATQAAAAARLGWTENAVRVAVHRLRRRFRELVKGELAQTVQQPDEVREELRYLLEVLSA